MSKLTRSDCLSVALILDERETALVIADSSPRELSEVRRLRRIFDTLSGRGLDFTNTRCHDPGTPMQE